MRFLKPVTTTFMTQVGGTVLVMVASIVIARVLQPAGKGVFAMVRAMAEMAVTLTVLGISKSLVYYVPRDDYDRRSLCRAATTLAAATGVVAIGAFGGIAAFTVGRGQLGESPWRVLLLGLLLVLTTLLIAWCESYLRGRHRILLLNAISAIRYVFYFGSVVLLAALGVLTPVSALLVSALGMAIVAGISMWGVVRDGASLRPAINRPVMRALLMYGVAYQAHIVVQKLHRLLNVILIARFLDETQVGYYSTSANLVQFIEYLPESISFVLVPLLAGLAADRESAERTATVCRITGALLVLGAGVMAATAGVVVPLLFGDAYAPSVLPLRLMLPSAVAVGLFQILGGYLLARRKLAQIVGIGASGVVLNVALSWWVIPRYGIAGAAIVSSVVCCIICVAAGFCVARDAGIRLRSVFILSRSDVTRLAGLVERLVKRLVERLRRRASSGE